MFEDKALVVPGSPESSPEARKVQVVRELELRGYVADPGIAGPLGEVLLRHPSAPDLWVCDDGSLQAAGNSDRGQPSAPPRQSALSIRWGRTWVVLIILAAITFLGLLILGMIVG